MRLRNCTIFLLLAIVNTIVAIGVVFGVGPELSSLVLG
jgi:hypothetical protein